MAIKRFTVDINGVVDPGSVCSNPVVTYYLPENLAVVCDNGDSIDIEINTDNAGPHCLTFNIDCSQSCSACGQIVVKKCFCVNPDDCPDCGVCTGNVCVSRCPSTQVCDNDTCVDCSDTVPCTCNQVCTQGKCLCPADKPIKRSDGCCVECIDGQPLGNCQVCIGGTIVTLDCPNGHCDPNTGECKECFNNTHCTAPNECCNEFGQCDCCPGYIRDPETEQCVPQPPCTDAQYCIDHYGKCYYCTVTGCAPIVCPEGFICDPATGNCVPECEGICPEGQGCINGRCVPCDQLSCTGGAGLQCQFAAGCGCVGNECEYIDCSLDNVSAEWVQTQGTPGTIVPGTGSPALIGTTSITAGGIVSLQAPNNGNYREHTFVLGVSNGTTGQWVLRNTPNDSISLGAGTSVTFDLGDTQGPNLVGFVVDFTETGTGRTARWTFWRTPTAPLTEPNVWFYTFSSQGIPPQEVGGTSGSLQLCLTNGNFQPLSVTNVVTTGTISVAFFPSGNCLTAIVQGCGTWNGDIVAKCGGQTLTVPAPELSIPLDSCCDPTDADCGVGFGEPCTDLTVQNINLVALPTYGSGAGGDGEFLVIADWTSAGLSFGDLFWLNPSSGCWSTPDNTEVTNDDLVIVSNDAQSPFGPSVSSLSKVVTLGDGGCIALGETCTLRISGCRRLEGRLCLDECDVFSVDIVDLGSNTYAAVPSLQDEVVTYEWVYPGLLATSNQTVTITPVGGTSTLIVTARYGSPVKCTDSDSITLNTFVPGCTNPSACNYNSAANINDNSCVFVAAPSYVCAEGGFTPGQTTAGESTIVYKIGSTTIVTGTASALLAPGNYTVDVYVDGVLRCSKPLAVPQCYRCSSGDCVIAPIGDNWGPYTASDCDGECDCNIEINVQENACANGGRSWTLRASGGSGSYTIRVDELAGGNILPLQALASSGSVTTPILCSGVYTITVTDNVANGCTESETRSVNCPCDAGSALALSSGTYNCSTNQLEFVPTPGQCSDTVTVKLLTSGGVQVGGASATYSVDNLTSSPGTRYISLGVYPGDGTYTLQIIDNRGCFKNYELVLNCDETLADCPITSLDVTYTDDGSLVDFTATFVLSEAGGSYTVRLFETTGGGPTNCIAAVPAGQIGATVTVTGVLGSNVVNFPDAVSVPGTGTCYAVTVQRLGTGYGSCNETDTVLVVPSGAPVPCTMEITNTTYNTATGQLLVSWNSEGGTGNTAVEIEVYSGGTCVGTPTVITESFPTADGVNVPFDIPQTGTAQCVNVTVYDSGTPSCIDSVDDIPIAACTCQVVITDVTIITSEPEEAFIEFTTRCTSGDINFNITGDATGSAVFNDGSEDGTVDSHNITIPLTGYPSTGGLIDITATDDVDGGCTDTESNVVLPENCVGCNQVVTLMTSLYTLEEVRDADGNAIIGPGSFDLEDDEAAIEAGVEAGVISQGGNFCSGDTPVDLQPSRAGMAVTQDNSTVVDLDYALITEATFGDQRTYFGDCGCETGRLCDYEAVIAVGAADTYLTFFYANGNAAGGYSSNVQFSGLSQAPSGSWLAAAEAGILSALENAFGCTYTVGGVSVTYDSGADTLTITITETNAGIGVVAVSNGAVAYLSNTSVEDFTQSNCTAASS